MSLVLTILRSRLPQTGSSSPRCEAAHPAEKAGLQTGDVITAIDGTAVTNASQLSAAIDAKSPGDTVELTYLRDGKTKTATVTLGTRPS
mgnify:CR=1 FL=1